MEVKQSFENFTTMIDYRALINIFQCSLLTIAFVLSLYLSPGNPHRDDPATAKKRTVAVSVIATLSPLFTYYCADADVFAKHSIWELLGIKIPGFFMATTVPLILTMILFLGPLAIQSQNGHWDLYSEPTYWFENVRNLLWLRDHIVAPLSEELTFRACMLPILVQSFRPQAAIFICPLFFGVAHLHHIFGRLKSGINIKAAICISVFQLSYTTLFGAYSAYLFLRTGHIIAPFLAHAFCNHMGFPDFSEVIWYKEPKRSITFLLCVIGLITWCALLDPLTNPVWYQNTLYWKS